MILIFFDFFLLVFEGNCKFVCGQTNCDVEWPFEEVCKMALLSPEEIEYFEKKMFANAAKDYLDVKAVSTYVTLSTNCSQKLYCLVMPIANLTTSHSVFTVSWLQV